MPSHFNWTLHTAFWHRKVKIIRAVHCEAGVFIAVKLRTQNLQLPVLSLHNLRLLIEFIKIHFFAPHVQYDIYFSYLDVSKYIPCTLDYPSEWWGVEVHGQLTDTDNPKTCTSFGHEQKSKTVLWLLHKWHVSFTCLLRKQSVFLSWGLRSRGAESRHFTPSLVCKLRSCKGNLQAG